MATKAKAVEGPRSEPVKADRYGVLIRSTGSYRKSKLLFRPMEIMPVEAQAAADLEGEASCHVQFFDSAAEAQKAVTAAREASQGRPITGRAPKKKAR